MWAGVHLAHNPFLQFFPLFATATSQSIQCLYKTKRLVYRLLIVLVQDEVVRKKEQEMTLKEAKRREMMEQVRTYFNSHGRTTSDENATQGPYHLLLGEETLSVAHNPPAGGLHIVAGMALVRLSHTLSLSLSTSTCVSLY